MLKREDLAMGQGMGSQRYVGEGAVVIVDIWRGL